jgi:hypothetical protein
MNTPFAHNIDSDIDLMDSGDKDPMNVRESCDKDPINVRESADNDQLFEFVIDKGDPLDMNITLKTLRERKEYIPNSNNLVCKNTKIQRSYKMINNNNNNSFFSKGKCPW